MPVRFTPTDSVYKGQSCAGVNIVLTDRDHCDVIDIGILMAKVLNRWYPEQFKLDKMDVLMLNKETLKAIKADEPVADIRKLWAGDLEKFKARRAKYLLY